MTLRSPSNALEKIQKISTGTGLKTVGGVPEGYESLIIGDLAKDKNRDLLIVARDDVRLQALATSIGFFAPELNVLTFPAWDCLPYDRVSPHGDIMSQRIDCLSSLATTENKGRVVLTTVSACLQRIPEKSVFAGASMTLQVGDTINLDDLTAFLTKNGYVRTETVMEAGEFALRGGIVDIFPTGAESPFRLDFFGDDLDGIRAFDATSQRTTDKATQFSLKPVSEILLDEDSISRFRTGYRALIKTDARDDLLYEAVSAGRRHIGMEHWLPLFHDGLGTLFDYLENPAIVLDSQVDESADARLDLIAEYYAARCNVLQAGTGVQETAQAYYPVPPESLFLSDKEWQGLLDQYLSLQLSPFSAPETDGKTVDLGGKPGREFADARLRQDINVFDFVKTHIDELEKDHKTILIAARTEGSRDRMAVVMKEHGLEPLSLVSTWAEAKNLPKGALGLAVLEIERGFVTDDFAVISEQDILGDRLSRQAKRKIKPENFITEASSLSEGDYVVHVEHGIGQFEGLETIEAAGAPHDCLRLLYGGGDKLFLPVENIDLISRFGSEDALAQLDKLGGAAWQARKSRMKERIREIANQLIKTAASRELRPATKMEPPAGLFDEFCQKFPYTETEDQLRAITDIISDLQSGRPTDRLICGDVGFGKTEVALRAAFIAAMAGKQVAVVVPTTLLARQHYNNFVDRMKDFPIRVGQLSRLVTAKDQKLIKDEMRKGTMDIVIGTHALLAQDVGFKDLGLLIIDEEQHFGVKHKERLKSLKADIHVVTLSATPIPRTLQLALSGVREMSLIATPPVDRLAVRTFVMPFDPVVVREAIMRERYRGGQTFYVCPRIEDLDGLEEQLEELVPEVKVVSVHGRLSATALEEAVTSFYEGKYDVLLSTNIIESGLDLPSVNTMIIHRADMFGLAQLYQLRGRVGRSKTRAYAYLTLPPRKKLTKTAEKRLEVMQTLDTLGAGFSLASHDLDIRGAGNLLGDEQSGHIREVGIELYQQMLEEAVAEAKGLHDGTGEDDQWSPQIAIGMAVLIPDFYVNDLTVRMGLYRRLALLGEREELDAFAAELIDRFGPLPGEAENLLEIVGIKKLCKDAGIEKIDAGPKGAIIAFRGDQFSNPAGFVEFLTDQKGLAKLRPDHKLVIKRRWDTPQERLEGVRFITGELAKIAGANS